MQFLALQPLTLMGTIPNLVFIGNRAPLAGEKAPVMSEPMLEQKQS
jgi:hypothetical protein